MVVDVRAIGEHRIDLCKVVRLVGAFCGLCYLSVQVMGSRGCIRLYSSDTLFKLDCDSYWSASPHHGLVPDLTKSLLQLCNVAGTDTGRAIAGPILALEIGSCA